MTVNCACASSCRIVCTAKGGGAVGVFQKHGRMRCRLQNMKGALGKLAVVKRWDGGVVNRSELCAVHHWCMAGVLQLCVQVVAASK
jgi:hypothetical protein